MCDWSSDVCSSRILEPRDTCLLSAWYSPAEPRDTCLLSCLILASWASILLPAHLLHNLQLIHYQQSHKESPRILEWVAFPLSSRSSRPRNQTRVFCIAGGFLTNWAIKELRIITSSLNDSSRHRPTQVCFGGDSNYKSRPAHVAMTSQHGEQLLKNSKQN